MDVYTSAVFFPIKSYQQYDYLCISYLMKTSGIPKEGTHTPELHHRPSEPSRLSQSLGSASYHPYLNFFSIVDRLHTSCNPVTFVKYAISLCNYFGIVCNFFYPRHRQLWKRSWSIRILVLFLCYYQTKIFEKGHSKEGSIQ